jgi:hypothetical protein
MNRRKLLQILASVPVFFGMVPNVTPKVLKWKSLTYAHRIFWTFEYNGLQMGVVVNRFAFFYDSWFIRDGKLRLITEFSGTEDEAKKYLYNYVRKISV